MCISETFCVCLWYKYYKSIKQLNSNSFYIMAIHTTGTWKHDQHLEIIGDRYIAKVYDHSTTPSSYKDANSVLKAEAKANAALICDAVNNTAGAGIDPIAVPGMLSALSEARRILILCSLIDKSGQAKDAVTIVEKAIKDANL